MTVRRGTTALITLGLAGGQVLALATPQKWDTLVGNSPFPSPPAIAPSAETQTALEFRGVVIEDGEPLFSIYDPAARRAIWVRLNESGSAFAVQSYDADLASVVVQYKERVQKIALKQAKILLLALPPPPVPTALNPRAAASADTLEGDESPRPAVSAEEISRRRTLRIQSAR